MAIGVQPRPMGVSGSAEAAEEEVPKSLEASETEVDAAARRRAQAEAAEKRVAAASGLADVAGPTYPEAEQPAAYPDEIVGEVTTKATDTAAAESTSPSSVPIDVDAPIAAPAAADGDMTQGQRSEGIIDLTNIETGDAPEDPPTSTYGNEEAEARLITGLVERIGPDLPPDQAKTCYETLSKVLGNVLQNPSESKFRLVMRVPLQKKLGHSPEALNLLLILGFDDQGDAYTLHPDAALGPLRTALAAVQSSLLTLGSSAALRYRYQAEGRKTSQPPVPARAPQPAARASSAARVAPAAKSEASAEPAVAPAAASSAKRKAPQELIVRLTSPAGRSRLALKLDATLADLRSKVEAVSGIAPGKQQLAWDRDGQRPLAGEPSGLLLDLGLESGAAIYLNNSDAAMINVKVVEEDLGPKPALHKSALVNLPANDVSTYWKDGVVGPVSAVTPSQASNCRQGMQHFFAAGVNVKERIFGSHVFQPWIYDLACNPTIVGAVASVLRTETVLMYQSIIIARPPGQIGIGWHADGGGYLPLQPQRHFITAFVALGPCRAENGCLEYKRQGNGTVFPMELNEGQFSLHSATSQHTTTRNTSSQHRWCVVFRYISGDVTDVARGKGAEKDWAVLVSGKDTGNFRLLPRPSGTGREIDTWEEMKQLRVQRYGRLV